MDCRVGPPYDDDGDDRRRSSFPSPPLARPASQPTCPSVRRPPSPPLPASSCASLSSSSVAAATAAARVFLYSPLPLAFLPSSSSLRLPLPPSRPQSFSRLNWLAPLFPSSPLLPSPFLLQSLEQCAVSPPSSTRTTTATDCPKSPSNSTCTDDGRRTGEKRKPTGSTGKFRVSSLIDDESRRNDDNAGDAERKTLPLNLKKPRCGYLLRAGISLRVSECGAIETLRE